MKMLLMEFIFKVAEDVGGPRKEFLRIALKSVLPSNCQCFPHIKNQAIDLHSKWIDRFLYESNTDT